MTQDGRFYNCTICGRTDKDEICCAPLPGLPDFTPRLLQLQARIQELEHLSFMDRLAFELILEAPEQGTLLATQALVRIERQVPVPVPEDTPHHGRLVKLLFSIAERLGVKESWGPRPGIEEETILRAVDDLTRENDELRHDLVNARFSIEALRGIQQGRGGA